LGLDFSLQWHQAELQRVADEFLSKVGSLESLQAAAGSVDGFDRSTYGRMAELGWIELGAGAGGNAGADNVDIAVLYEAFGRMALGGPHFTCHLAARLLKTLDPQGTKDGITDICTGRSIVTVALWEPDGSEPLASTTRVTRSGSKDHLSGTKSFVPFASASDLVLLLATADGQPTFFMVSPNAEGISLESLPVLSGERQFLVRLDRVRVSHADRIGVVGAAAGALEDVGPWVDLVRSAELLGIAEASLQMAVQYAKDRMAFGHPIGSYQAIQHKCSEMLADRDAARYLVYQAACLLDQGAGTDVRIAMARAFVGEAARRITKEAHQIFAGAGFVLDHKLPFYYRRAQGLQTYGGGAGDQLDRVADSLLR